MAAYSPDTFQPSEDAGGTATSEVTMRSCDRCCAESKVEWAKGHARLDLCQHHSNEYGPLLIAEGWGAHQHIDEASDVRPGRPLVRRAT